MVLFSIQIVNILTCLKLFPFRPLFYVTLSHLISISIFGKVSIHSKFMSISKPSVKAPF